MHSQIQTEVCTNKESFYSIADIADTGFKIKSRGRCLHNIQPLHKKGIKKLNSSFLLAAFRPFTRPSG